jgi:hypothetical protein
MAEWPMTEDDAHNPLDDQGLPLAMVLTQNTF